jgi:predicted ATPase/DNA-binding SARP family transcriptional activator
VPTALRLIDGVRWHDAPIAGERAQTLLALLVLHAGDGVSVDRLVAELWGDDPPANPAKALQVVVSRTRSATSAEAVVHTARGYRLGVPADDVDALRLADLVAAARRALADGDPAAARRAAEEAVRLGRGFATTTEPDGDGALGEVRAAAAARAAEASRLLGQALSRGGEHEAALPGLLAAVAADPQDEALLDDLLRSEAAVRGPAAALERYDAYRRGLADRLGTDPGPALQRRQRELLAADRPVRSGLRYDATELVGREDDVRALRAAVRSARVTSIVGTGGLGKTRLAHLLGRDAEQPVVHFVELVGVTAPEDVVAEVGSALGVRDSVAGRRTLTPQQRADIRARTAQLLEESPALLILDNCEHVVGAVADLVAFLVGTVRDLRVVTTSRAPLAIAAERVYPLGQLGEADAAELFRQRALAARPGAALPDDAVSAVVARLDGLPLAIELAAAKVRVMSVEDVGRRLDDRFALLRGGDRTAPERHQTLLAVLDWSWQLLGDGERRALAWLSLFPDGFTLPAAEAQLAGARGVAPGGVLDVVRSLVDQSLVTVVETPHGVRYRMLETVREFGRLRLDEAGDGDAAAAAVRRWAASFALTEGARLDSADQVAAARAMRAEETNLADILRASLADGDVGTATTVLGALGSFWWIAGEEPRILSVATAVNDAVAGWDPPAELVDRTRYALSLVLSSGLVTVGGTRRSHAMSLLRRLGPGDVPTARIVLAEDPDQPGDSLTRLRELCEDPDRRVAALALQYYGHRLENDGDPERTLATAERALSLWRESDGPWARAMLQHHQAQVHAQLGRFQEAARFSAQALPALDDLDARDDAMQSRAILAVAAQERGDLATAERLYDEVRARERGHPTFGGDMLSLAGRAELAFARGEVARGLQGYREAARRMAEARFPGVPVTGIEPWTLMGEASAVTAFARHGRDDEGAELLLVLRDKAVRALGPDQRYLDYPVAGTVLFALGAWGLLRGAVPARDAVRLLVLADRFAYNRFVPTFSWDAITGPAEAAAPGEIAALQAEYGTRRGPDLLAEARALILRAYGEPPGAADPRHM